MYSMTQRMVWVDMIPGREINMVILRLLESH